LGNYTLDFEKITAKYEIRRNYFDDNINIVMVSQLLEFKNIDFSLKVVSEVSKYYDGFRLSIIGDGEYKKQLIKCSESLGLKNVEFLGWNDNDFIMNILSKSHILIHTSKLDRWPQVINEAISLNLPIIVSNLAGVDDDFIINDFNGYILPLNESIWINTLLDLLKNRNKLQQLSDNCSHILQKYKFENQVDKFINFAKVLNSK